MDLKTEIVFYEGEYRKVKLLIQEFELSLATYRNKRKLGWEPQKSFEHCLALKKKKEELKKLNIDAIAKKYGVTSQAIYKRLGEGKEISEIVSHLEIRNQKKEKIFNQFQKLEISNQYKDFYDFCIQEGLSTSSIYKNLADGMNLYDAIAYSFIGNPKNIKYIFHGILLKSLCQKYCLNYDTVQFLFRKTQNYEFTFMKAVFNQIFLKNFEKNREELWKIYIYSDLGDINFSKEIVDDKIIQLFFQVYWRCQALQKDFLYYQFLNTLDISFLISLNLEDRVRSVLSTVETFSFSLKELYFILDFEMGLMQDFAFLEKKNIWVYKGNRRVLEKLKPSI